MTLRKRLEAQAPLRLDHYIEACLWDADEGYYRRKEVLGSKGDFVTSPEISQIFGEVIGLWIVQTWQDMGEPARFMLLEMGAGRGVLMRDMLRIIEKAPTCLAALDLHILEKSEARRAEQSANIALPITFLDALKLPERPSIIVSNEFFDALPIRQFRNEGGGWLEAYVNGLIEKTWQPCARPPAALSPYLEANGIVEINEPAIAISKQLGDHLKAHGGAMLTIDYGDYDGIGDTFQAVENHQPANPFDNPGAADLTAHIRFRDLAEAAELSGDFMTQSAFLNAWGGQARLDALCAANPELAESLRADYNRLTSPKAMGELFKVLIQRAY